MNPLDDCEGTMWLRCHQGCRCCRSLLPLAAADAIILPPF